MGSLPANEGQARAPRKCNSTNMCSICMRTLAPTQLNQRSSAMLAHLGHGGNWNPKKAHGEASADVPALAHQNCQLLTRSPSGSEDRVGSVLTQKCGLLLSRPTLMAKANSHSPIYPFSPIITLSFSRMSTHVLKRKERMFHVSQLIVSMSPVTHKDRTGRAGHLQPSAHPERPHDTHSPSPPAASQSAHGDGSDTWLQPACFSPSGSDAFPPLLETATEAKVMVRMARMDRGIFKRALRNATCSFRTGEGRKEEVPRA